MNTNQLLYLSQADVMAVGLAMDDMATAPLIYRRAVERGIGAWLPL